MALHYKRFLILCCGLDQRERLFGEFYDRSSNINFISMDFQEKYCRFIHDADGTGLLSDPEADTRPSLESYIKQANQHLRSGSRVFCEWRQVVNPVTAPGAAKDDSGNGYRGHSFTVDFVKAVVPAWHTRRMKRSTLMCQSFSTPTAVMRSQTNENSMPRYASQNSEPLIALAIFAWTR